MWGTCGEDTVTETGGVYLVSHLGYVRTSAGDRVCDPGGGKPLLQSEPLLLQLCPLKRTHDKVNHFILKLRFCVM